MSPTTPVVMTLSVKERRSRVQRMMSEDNLEESAFSSDQHQEEEDPEWSPKLKSRVTLPPPPSSPRKRVKT